MRDEKAIKKHTEGIFRWLNSVEEKMDELRHEKSDPKKAKLEKKIKSDEEMIVFVAQKLGKAGGSIDELFPEFNELQKQIVSKLFQNGTDNNAIQNQENRNNVINRHKRKIAKIQEAYQKYPAYDPNLPVKEKLENKIYKLEKSLGRDLFAESDKERSIYQPDWNYLEHMAASNEFTDEEREIMDRCYKVGEEYNSYWFGRFEQIGDAAQEWGNATQAKIWCKKMCKNTFTPFVKRLNPNIRTAEQLEYESKEMTKRYIEFMLSKEQHESLVKKWNELYCDSSLERYSEDEKLDIIADAMAKVVGEEKAVFTGIFVTATQNVKDAIELIGNYTYEELGLE